jgi:hypothetical protein
MRLPSRHLLLLVRLLLLLLLGLTHTTALVWVRIAVWPVLLLLPPRLPLLLLVAANSS